MKSIYHQRNEYQGHYPADCDICCKNVKKGDKVFYQRIAITIYHQLSLNISPQVFAQSQSQYVLSDVQFDHE